MQSITNIARPKIDVFVRLPQFVRAGEQAPGTVAAQGRLDQAEGKASKVQGSCANAPLGVAKVKPRLKLRSFHSAAKRLCANGGKAIGWPKHARVGGQSAGDCTKHEKLADAGLENSAEDYIDFGEFDDLDEEFLLKIAEQDPRVQALLDAGDESDSSISNDDDHDSETATPFKTDLGLRPQEDLDLWDHVCAAIWPEGS